MKIKDLKSECNGFAKVITLENGEDIVIFPGSKNRYWTDPETVSKYFSSVVPGTFRKYQEKEDHTYAFILFRKSSNVYKITISDFQQLLNDKFESEEDLVERLMVARI